MMLFRGCKILMFSRSSSSSLLHHLRQDQHHQQVFLFLDIHAHRFFKFVQNLKYMCNTFFAAYHYGYVQQYNLYNQYGYHQQALPQVAHPRTGSNLSSGSSNNGGPLGGHHQQQHHGHHNKHSSRPKSNYYEYEMYNNNPASYMSTASSAASSSNSHYPSNSDHPQMPPGQPHPAMYSLPRSSSGY